VGELGGNTSRVYEKKIGSLRACPDLV